MKRRGFTIVELLVVVTVIIVLLGLLTAGWEEAYTYAMRVKCQHNLEQIWSACMMYSTAHANRWPQIWNWGSVSASKPWYDTLVQTGYLSDSRVTVCPSSNVPIGAGEGGYTSPQTTVALEAINKALNWLNDRANQSVSGNNIYWGSTDNNKRIGVTALCLLAFMGAGHDINSTAKGDPSDPPFGETILKGLRFLAAEQSGDGFWSGTPSAPSFYWPYIQGIATMAVCDAYNMMGDIDLGGGKTLGPVAGNAVSALLAMQHPISGGWPYGGQGYHDTSANIWGFQGLWSAMLAGLFDPQSEPYATRLNYYFANCANPGQLGVGGVGYRGYNLPRWQGDTAPSLENWQCGPRVNEGPWRMTAAVMAVRMLLGRLPSDTGVQSNMIWLKYRAYNGVPSYMTWATRNATASGGRQTGTYDIYFTYYMTIALWKYGGNEWVEWCDIMVPGLLNVVTPVSDTKHYWNYSRIVDIGSPGHAYPTALAAMTLEMTVGRYLVGSKYYVSGSHTYGYNDMLGEDSKTASGDTIAVMDYMKWAVNYNDNESMIAPRHGGRMNIIFVDGRCQAYYPEQIMVGGKLPIGMLTPQAGD